VKPPPTFPLRCLAALLLWLGAAAWARAEPVPLVVERLERDVPADAAAAVVGSSDAGFVSQPYAAITPRRSRGVWYRLRLIADWNRAEPPLLAVANPQGLVLVVHAPPDYAGVPASVYRPDANPGFTRHRLMIPLPPGLRADTPVYLYVAPERAIPRGVEIMGAAEARAHDLVWARLDILLPSIQLTTLLVVLCFFLVLRERMYAYFVGHVLFLVLYELYMFGIGYEMPPFDLAAPMRLRVMWFAAAMATLLLLLFSMRFLDIARSSPRLARWLGASRWPLPVLGLCALVPGLSRGWWVEDALVAVVLLIVPLLLVAALSAWHHGGRRGGYYLCGWLPALLFVIVRALQIGLQWPLPPWLEFALPAAFAFSGLVLSFGLADQTLSIRHERDVAHRLAERDMLTGVLNRRAILAHLRATFLHARESGSPLALLFLDLDHFKQINDSHGHAAGDQCLRAVVRPIASELREGDAVGRYGGEEFLVVLPGAAAANAMVVAERIRARVQTMPVLVSGTRIGLTLSVGVAALDDAVATPDALIERADAALYRSKAGGRNQVQAHESAGVEPAVGT
jgi:diguanylate cyclase (GGDEF)-like protein